MNEPNRIGLTEETHTKLDELLEHLNPEQGEDGIRLIKFDIYRLAVALGIKERHPAEGLCGKSISSFRVSELDEGGLLHTVITNMDIVPDGCSTYEYIERLAEDGIKRFYDKYQQTGEIPFVEYFS
ncbi:MAG: hypothetical protein OQK94_03465 [Gammaproteobacteria bacterium]|nr:hypothetical protein [Gammaproteobacteria bacterium]MCW8839752.1 hypothetical protein [Gammaproteobacteria bacterium]MCW8959274.1 hypothetical protein [Gammaproteobacteria bacterium]MCW8992435.1 hypothetical protein [Gammaproteobacteria bacterium]